MSRIVVYHSTYGCETGCCGHTVEMNEPMGSKFTFSHPYFGYDSSEPWGYRMDSPEAREWAEKLIAEMYGEEHVKDLDWEESYIVNS